MSGELIDGDVALAVPGFAPPGAGSLTARPELPLALLQDERVRGPGWYGEGALLYLDDDEALMAVGCELLSSYDVFRVEFAQLP